MINTTVARFVIESGSQQTFNLSSITCEPVYYELTETFNVALLITDTVATIEIGRGGLQVTKAEVDAETGAGSGETAPWFNALQKAVITKLSAMTGNSGTTFTIV